MKDIKNTVTEAVTEAVTENKEKTDEHAHRVHLAAPQGSYLMLLSLAALGVVYGDIGTSRRFTPCANTFTARTGCRSRRPTCSACCRWSSGR